MQVLDVRTRALQSQIAMEDVCGVAPSAQGFLVTSGLGTVCWRLRSRLPSWFRRLCSGTIISSQS